MAKKEAGIKSFDEAFLKNRFESLKKFVTSLVDHPALRAHPAVVGFLRLDDAKFSTLRKTIDNKKNPYSFFNNSFALNDFEKFDPSHLQTETGEARVKIGEFYHKYSVELEKVLKDQNNTYSDIKAKILQLHSGLRGLSDILNHIAADFEKLEKSSMSFSTATGSKSWSDLGKTHNNWKTVSRAWSQQLLNNADEVKEQLFTTFKYSRKECEAGLETLKVRNMAANKFFETERIVDDVKEKLITSYPDISKWDLESPALKYSKEDLLKDKKATLYLMNPSKRQAFTNMRTAFGYLNTLLESEFERQGNMRASRETKALGAWCRVRKEVMDSEVKALDNCFNQALERLNPAPPEANDEAAN